MKMMEAVRSQVSPLVFAWVNLMSLVMLSSAFFMFGSTTALLVFISAIGSVAIAYALWLKTDNIYMLGSVHVPLWGPLLVYIIGWELPALDLSTTYGLWLTAAAATMAISLVFDVRDTAQVLSGRKSTKATEA